MQRFGLCSGSGLGATNREEADGHMLCEQDPSRSLDELHDNGEGTFGSSLRTREILAVHLREQDHYLHRSCGPKILALQEGGQTTTHTMGVASSRIQLEDKTQEGQRELSGKPLIGSPRSKVQEKSVTHSPTSISLTS